MNLTWINYEYTLQHFSFEPIGYMSGLVKVCFSIFDEINDRLENIVHIHGVRNAVDSAIDIPVNLKKIGI